MRSQFELIRNAVLKRAVNLSRRVPVDIASIARSLGVVEISPKPIDFDGYLARRPDGQLAIRYREDSSITRIRFTIAHEIAHILIAEVLGIPIEAPVARARFRDDVEENLANRIAAELLLPADWVLDMLAQNRTGWSTVLSVAHASRVSVSAVIRRIGELQNLPYFEVKGRLSTEGKLIGSSRILWHKFSRLRLLRHPDFEAQRLVRELESQEPMHSQHSIEVEFDGEARHLPLIGQKLNLREAVLVKFVGWGNGHPVRRWNRSLSSSVAKILD